MSGKTVMSTTGLPQVKSTMVSISGPDGTRHSEPASFAFCKRIIKTNLGYLSDAIMPVGVPRQTKAASFPDQVSLQANGLAPTQKETRRYGIYPNAASHRFLGCQQ